VPAADLLRDRLFCGEACERNCEPRDADGDEGVRSVRLAGEKQGNAESGVTRGDDAMHEAGIFHVGEPYSLGNQASKYLTECLSRRSISA
jgi:hypothetical protein